MVHSVSGSQFPLPRYGAMTPACSLAGNKNWASAGSECSSFQDPRRFQILQALRSPAFLPWMALPCRQSVSFRWCPSLSGHTGRLLVSNWMPSCLQAGQQCQPNPGEQEELGWMPAALVLVLPAPGDSLAGNGSSLLFKPTKVLGRLFY